jgi:hypothetical protein
MAQAIFGLIGVIVGGLLQGGVSWLMERRRDDWALRKAGRLFGPELARCQLALEQAVTWEPPMNWETLLVGVNSTLSRWPEHADVFAGSVSQAQWVEILNVVSKVQALEYRAPDERAAAIRTDDHARLIALAGELFEAMLTCVLIGERGARRPRLRSMLRSMLRPRATQSGADQIASQHPARRAPEGDRR